MNTIEPNNNDLQEGIKKLIDFFCKVHKETCVELSYYKYPRFIYRGISKYYPYKSIDGINHTSEQEVQNDYIRSGLSVRLDMTICKENLHKRMIPYIRANYINALRDMIKTAKKQFPNKYVSTMSDLEILADIQHNGGATCLVDFSKNILTALWFACNTDFGSDGFVYCYDIMNDIIAKDNLSYVKDESCSIESLLAQTYRETNICSNVETRFCIWEPTPHSNRIIRQDSVFIFGMEKFKVCEHGIKVIKIKAEDKRCLLLALESLFNVSESTIFNDYIGFAIANRKMSAYRKLEINAYSRGFDDMINGNYEAALEFLKLHAGEKQTKKKIEKLIELHFSLAVIYKYLRRANGSIHYKENSILEYSEVIKLVKKLFRKKNIDNSACFNKDYYAHKCTRAYNGIFDMLYETKQFKRAISKCEELITDINNGILGREVSPGTIGKDLSPIYCRITQMELMNLQIMADFKNIQNYKEHDIDIYRNKALSIVRENVYFDRLLIEYYTFIYKVLLTKKEDELRKSQTQLFAELKNKFNNTQPYNGYILWNFADIKNGIESLDLEISPLKKEILYTATAQIISFRDEFEVQSLRNSQEY